ncbi:mucin-3A-like isoform X47 [Patiria miniata]|uniref:Uncharacterized protein n=1 Tax=Patiria miniata TaxID=46514 RepID=A0A914BFB0_PATMI|nr:mucin-3A-like isoform X47 [Patiria miniata]
MTTCNAHFIYFGTKSYFVVQILLSMIGDSTAHPQCLDFFPPFSFDQGDQPEFCTLYQDFGCCTLAKDRQIRQTFQTIVTEYNTMHGSLSSNCSNFLREILCQDCSPYAAHVFDGEDSPENIRQLPGLCSDYCTEFHRYCGQLVPFITTEELVRQAAADSAVEFCDRMAITDMDYCFPDVLTDDDLSKWVGEAQSGTGRSQCLCLEEFAGGLRNPIFAIHANDNTHRLFIGEQLGVIHVFLENRTRLETPFLDIRDSVTVKKFNGDERGLLGAAFHPNFTDNSKFYVFYTAGPRLNNIFIRISEFKVMANDKNRADVSTEKVILDEDQPFVNHNGGQLLFGLDGYLYASLGDGGAGGDPHNVALNKNSLLGKILRIDVDSQTGGRNYGIPPDNPFVGVVNTRPEIYAYGVRNSWRGSVDRGDRLTGYGKGRMFFGDVGQSSYEEVNIIVKGGNYGWRAKEGFSCFKSGQCNDQWLADEVLPIHSYPHSEGKCVIGGFVYRGCQSPNLNGKYIFGDFQYGRLFQLTENTTTNTWERQDICLGDSSVCKGNLLNTFPRYIMSFAEDERGEVYFMGKTEQSANNDRGQILKIVDPGRRGNPSECSTEVSTVVDNPTTPAESTTTADLTSTMEPRINQLPTSDSPITTGRPITTESPINERLATTDSESTTTADLTSTMEPRINQLPTNDSPITTSRPITTESPINGRLATTDSESTTTADLTSTMEPRINQLPTSDLPITTSRPITTESPINGRLATTDSESTTTADLTSAVEANINQLPTTDSQITTGRPITTESPINGRLATTDSESTTTADLTSTVEANINQLTTSDSPITTSRPITTESPINGRLATTDSESTTTADLTSTVEANINQLTTSDSPITTSRPITTESPINGRLATTDSESTTTADLTSTVEANINQLTTSDSPITTSRPITTESPINGRLATTDSESTTTADLTSTVEANINQLPTTDSQITTGRPITTESPINGRLATTDSESTTTADLTSTVEANINQLPTSDSPITTSRPITTESPINGRLATTDSESTTTVDFTSIVEVNINQLPTTDSPITTGRPITTESPINGRLATTDSESTTTADLTSTVEANINQVTTSDSPITTCRPITTESPINGRLATTDSESTTTADLTSTVEANINQLTTSDSPITTSRPITTESPINGRLATTDSESTTTADLTSTVEANINQLPTTDSQITTGRPITTESPINGRLATTDSESTTTADLTSTVEANINQLTTSDSPITTSRPITTESPINGRLATTDSESTTTADLTSTVEANINQLTTSDSPITTGRPITTESPINGRLATTDSESTTTADLTSTVEANINQVTTSDSPITTSRPITTESPINERLATTDSESLSTTDDHTSTDSSNKGGPSSSLPVLSTETNAAESTINQLITTESSTTGRSSTSELANDRLATTGSTLQLNTEESLSSSPLVTTETKAAESTINQLLSTESSTTGRLSTSEFADRLATTDSILQLTTEGSLSSSSLLSTETKAAESTINQLLTTESSTTGRSSTSEFTTDRLATTDSTLQLTTEVTVGLRILALNGISARFTADLTNSSSQAFRELSAQVTMAVLDILRGSPSTALVMDFVISSIRNGSLLVNGVAIFPTNSVIEANALVQVLNSAGSNDGDVSSSLTIDPSATYAAESLSSSPLVTTETKAAESTINQLLSTESSTTGRLSTSEFADRLATTDSILQLTTEGSLSSSSLLSTETKAAESTINQLLTTESSTTGRSSTSEFTTDRLATTDSTLQLTTEVTVGLRILALNGISARFTDDLTDSSSQAFRELSAQVTMAVLDILRGSPSTALVMDFVISSIRNGSLLVNGVAIFPTNSVIEANALVQVLNSAGSNDGDVSSSLTIDPSATYAAVPNQGCPTNYCTNGGICKQVGSPQDHVYSCECVEGYAGRLCENGGPDSEGDNFPVVVILAAVGVLVLAIVGLMAAVIMIHARFARSVEKPETNTPRYHHQRSFGVGFVDRATTRPPSQYWVRNLERDNFRLPYVVPDTPVEEFWGDAVYY